MHDTKEEWKWILGYEESYEVSNFGRVRSYRVLNRYQRKVPHLLKPNITKHGYAMVGVYRNGQFKYLRMNRVVAETFLGPCPKNKVVCHYDGDKLNNSLDNLGFVSSKENEAHKVAHGTRLSGEQIWNAKLSKDKVSEIRQLLFMGWTQLRISKKFGISRSAISDIKLKKLWNCV